MKVKYKLHVMKDIDQKTAKTQFSPRFTHPFRVYFEDTDVGGIVYNANYLKYLERARSEWLRASGINQSTLLAETGLAFAVRKTSAEYLKPARLDDMLEVDLAIEKIARAQIFFRQQVRRVSPNQELLLTATAQIVCINLSTMKPASIPPSLQQQLGL